MDTDELLAAMRKKRDEPPRAVHIKGLGDIHVRWIKVKEYEDPAKLNGDKDVHTRMARGACRLITDENGVRKLDHNNPEHLDLMLEMPLSTLVEINEAAEGGNPGN